MPMSSPVVPVAEVADSDPGALRWSPGFAPAATIALFVLAHVGLGAFADYSPPPIITLHAILVLLAGLWLAGVRRSAEGAVCMLGYVAACDVLWRMTGASVPWEVSKLALAGLGLLAIVRIVGQPRRFGLPLLVLFLLLPSAMVTVERFGLLGNGRERLTFELGAHVALVVMVVLFSNLRAERQVLAGVLWCVVAPVLAVNTIATVSSASLLSSDFSGGSSNVQASGGYGPNQVSALIGVGAMLCVFLVFIDRRPVLRLGAAALALWFLTQSALTFSRGGSFNLIVALLVALPFLLRSARSAIRFITVASVVGVVIWFALIPALQSMTGGQFGERFTSSDPTLRTDIMRAELEAWNDNIALGIGVGMMERTDEDRGAADRGELPKLPAHTEYTRLLAEHGLLGLAVIVALLALAIRAVRGQVLPLAKIFSVMLVVWCASEVAHSATRLALVPYLFGLAALQILPDGVLTGGRAAAPPPDEAVPAPAG